MPKKAAKRMTAQHFELLKYIPVMTNDWGHAFKSEELKQDFMEKVCDGICALRKTEVSRSEINGVIRDCLVTCENHFVSSLLEYLNFEKMIQRRFNLA